MDSMNKKHVLMIEDDENVLTTNVRVLTRASGGVLCCYKARTLAEARDAIAKLGYDLIILDIMLPDGSGLDFIPEIHAATNAPILILSARNTPSDIIEGITRGGDNYITKPYEPEAMTAIALAMLRREEKRAKPEPAKTITRGPLTLDIVASRANINGTDSGLKPKEYALLSTLVQNEGRLVSAKELYETVWNLPVNDDVRTVWSHISKLKKKLLITDFTPLTITVERGNGYCFEYNETMDLKF